MNYRLISLAILLLVNTIGYGQERRVLDPRLHHLRRPGPAEWTEFPGEPENAQLAISFTAQANVSEWALRVRQQDVKQAWFVTLNDKSLGQLVTDENDMIVYFAVPSGTLKDGENKLVVQEGKNSRSLDDVRVGEIELIDQPVEKALSAGQIRIEVVDAESNTPIPARITVTTDEGTLHAVGARSTLKLAVRPGTVYTADGHADFGVPAGKYTVWAGRGFEYSLASIQVDVAAGDTVQRKLVIRREVPTPGYVACDTHVHTLTHSGHGDASIEERMVTLAAECIELPIATDHNKHVNYEVAARAAGVRPYFTPVVGNEVTTPVGHFNVFPVAEGARVPNASHKDWKVIFAEIYDTPGVKGVVLNHARDLHSGVRPFGPILHNAAVGENLDGWRLQANAMEVINSGATQTDVRRLFLDWMVMLNRGHRLTPVGSSDSHDVARHFVGQGRTYIRTTDDDPGNIDVGESVTSFLQGQVMVSYGLLAQVEVNGRYGSGELAQLGDGPVRVHARVLGPSWVQADRIEFYVNGLKVREVTIPADSPRKGGVLWSGDWEMPRPAHDVHLVALALGPGVEGSYWKTAKPYQPLSPDWQAHVIGCSGAVWLDGDQDGRCSSAYDYAWRVVAEHRELPELLEKLGRFDEAVAAQAAHLWHEAGHSVFAPELAEALRTAAPPVRAGFSTYRDARRENERARAEAGKSS